MEGYLMFLFRCALILSVVLLPGVPFEATTAPDANTVAAAPHALPPGSGHTLRGGKQ